MTPRPPPAFLTEILRRKEEEIALRRLSLPEAQLEARACARLERVSLFAALSPRGGRTRVIAEVKRASPSLGEIDTSVDAPALARVYAAAGAAAISVLTDGPGFGGSLADLASVGEHVDVPVLRKDFILHRYQLLEALAAGADAVLLIAAALSPARLRELHAQCAALRLDALVEVHQEDELAAALEAGARIIGVNNRNLETFEVDLATSERLLPLVPAHVRAVAESGVKGPAEAARLVRAGAVNLLVGEALVRSPDPAALLKKLIEAA